MRFLHLADVHLDTAFGSRSSEVRELLRKETREALTLAVREALRLRVDALLIAGDLFDSERISVGTERFLQDLFRPLGESGLPVFYATGNHDPDGIRGGLDRGELPSDLHLFDRVEPRRIQLLRDGVPVGSVTGAGHSSAREAEDLSRRFRPPGDGLPAVALLHTQVLGSRGAAEHDRYAPSELAYLRTAGFDYWALGHVHQREELERHPPIHYPGNLFGRSPRERGAKGGLLVELGPDSPPRVQFLELARIRWEELTLSGLDEIERPADLLHRLVSEWGALRAADPGLPGGRWLLRLHLEGPSPLFRSLSRDEDREDLRREVARELDLLELELRTDRLRPELRVEDHLDRVDLLGEALRLLNDLVPPDGPSPSELLGLAAGDLAGAGGLANRQELDRYLRGLLRDGGTELLATLLRQDRK